MHKFMGGRHKRPLAVDLDQVCSCEQHPDDARITQLWLPYHVTIAVDMPIDDVLALISPPAAPDPYEAELAERIEAMRQQGPDKIREAWLNRPLIDEEVKTARLDELTRIETALKERLGYLPVKLTDLLDWRREAIRKGEV